MRVSFGHLWDRFVHLFYLDQARLTEWLTFGFLLNFWHEFYINPEIVERDTYRAFALIGADIWVLIIGAIIALQAAAIFWHGRRTDELRTVAMTFSVAFWLTVGLAFSATGISTTAAKAYFMLMIVTFLAWLFLLFKSAVRL